MNSSPQWILPNPQPELIDLAGDPLMPLAAATAGTRKNSSSLSVAQKCHFLKFNFFGQFLLSSEREGDSDAEEILTGGVLDVEGRQENN